MHVHPLLHSCDSLWKLAAHAPQSWHERNLHMHVYWLYNSQLKRGEALALYQEVYGKSLGQCRTQGSLSATCNCQIKLCSISYAGKCITCAHFLLHSLRPVDWEGKNECTCPATAAHQGARECLSHINAYCKCLVIACGSDCTRIMCAASS